MYQTEKNIFNLLKQSKEFLTSHNITEAQLDAEVLFRRLVEEPAHRLRVALAVALDPALDQQG
ncbi:MAG: hypothetical protein II090_01315, partial [Elusimicrobia bacterium]|nr:hypothetical protein [Elusimicrobiota bacterium]